MVRHSVAQEGIDGCLPQELANLFSAPSMGFIEERLRLFSRPVLARLGDPAPLPFPRDSDPDVIRSAFADEFPDLGEPLEQVLDHLGRHALPYCSNKRARRYFAQMDVPPADLSVFSGLLIRAMAQDPIAYSSSRSGTFIEKQVSQWLSELIFPGVAAAGGVMTSGGTQSNFQALLLLRNLAFKALGIDVSRLGLQEALRASGKRDIAFLVSPVAHQSIFTALRFLGLGDRSASVVAVDEDEQIAASDLREKLASARDTGVLVAGVVLTACTTGCGAVDPLEEAIEAADEFGVPVHVDAAHGGMLLFSRRHGQRLTGIEKATTVTFDPHKILGLNQSLGFLALRDTSLLNAMGKVELQYYCREREPDLGDWTIDNSRSLNSLGAWILMRSIGRRGYEGIVDHVMALSETFRERIRDHARFRILCDAPMNVVAFGLVGPLEEKNDRTQALLNGVLAGGEFAISRYCRRSGEVLLRAVFVNPASTIEDVHALADRLIDVAETLNGRSGNSTADAIPTANVA
ncbi:hypothetical protein KXR53_34770 [Inquilinus limosus]|uniref:pyridoxal phosphate-dependent decarboxylase family protein n=1 Tax=Inquilinus limosus TaxID=171674 RepID=UPI003F18977F